MCRRDSIASSFISSEFASRSIQNLVAGCRGFGEHLTKLFSECSRMVVVATVAAGERYRRNAKLLGESEGGAAGQLARRGFAHAHDDSRRARAQSGNVRDVKTDRLEAMAEKI